MVSCLLLPVTQAGASIINSSAPGSSLGQRAVVMGLHQSPQWRALLHYRPAWTGGSESTVDDPAFFISPEGKTSPEAELRAFIESMYTEAGRGDAHPACRFPVRAGWLRQELGMEEDGLPSPQCAGLSEYMRKVDPASAALVFPESHINSPASMFGHTLIRLDSGSQSRLLSYAVSYAAEMPEDPGPLYAIRGVMGGYKGSFSLLPYYEKLKEYSHMESRDIWEYGLDLTPEEVRRMALHIWELRDIRSDYYFFDENCSYALLFLIEAARPETRLADGFRYWVLPTDTIRALRREGLINSVAYRPSKAARIAHLESLADGAEGILSVALDVGSGDAGTEVALDRTDLTERDRALALDLAAEYTLHEYMRGRLLQDTYSARYLETLSARSTLMKREYSIPSPPSPETGHGTARVTIGAGRQGDEDFELLGFRFSYHGLMDPLRGYTPGAAIEVLKAEARHYHDTGETLLESFTMFEITSLWPGGNLIRPLSWHIRAGAWRELSPEGERTPAVLEGGAGLAAGLGKSGLGYFLIEPSLKAGGGIREDYALGAGLSMGAFFEMGGVYNLMLGGRAFYYPAGHRHSQRSVSLRQGMRLSQNTALLLDYSRSMIDGLHMSDTSLGLHLYF